MHTLFLFGTMKIRDPGLDGKMTLKWFLRKSDAEVSALDAAGSG
jgi:hypothetical protein